MRIADHYQILILRQLDHLLRRFLNLPPVLSPPTILLRSTSYPPCFPLGWRTALTLPDTYRPGHSPPLTTAPQNPNDGRFRRGFQQEQGPDPSHSTGSVHATRDHKGENTAGPVTGDRIDDPTQTKGEQATAKVTKGRFKGPVDFDKQCGVINIKGRPCSRSLSCKSHSMSAKRDVQGRSKPYDELLLEWNRANRPNFVEPVRGSNPSNNGQTPFPGY